eukprot:6337338-Pyramimonas_sp.AAC.1
MIDMWNCFDTVLVAELLSEARAARYPLRLIWQLVAHYAMPRAAKAHGSLSDRTVGRQCIPPGYTHATTLLTVLMMRTMQRVKMVHPTIHPRAL